MRYNIALLPKKLTNYITNYFLWKVMRYNIALLPKKVTHYVHIPRTFLLAGYRTFPMLLARKHWLYSGACCHMLIMKRKQQECERNMLV